MRCHDEKVFIGSSVCGITALATTAQNNETISVADLVGDYNVSYYLPEECNYKGEMTVGAGDADNTNAPEVYYNLQGFPVSNPEKGLFIVRKGDKTVKILK